MFNFFVVAGRLFLVFCVCLDFDDLANQWRKVYGGVSEVGKNAVGLHTQEHTTGASAVPGLHPWQVVIIHLPAGAHTAEARQGWTNRWVLVGTNLHEGLQKPSLASHILQLSPTTTQSHIKTAAPPRIWTYTLSNHRGAEEALKTTNSSHQGLVHTFHDHTQKGSTLWWQQPAPDRGLQPRADKPGLGLEPTGIVHAVVTMAKQDGGAKPMGASHHQRGGGIHTLQGTPHASTPARPQPPYPQ